MGNRKSNQTAEYFTAILRLLRYQLYDSMVDQISLEKETESFKTILSFKKIPQDETES